VSNHRKAIKVQSIGKVDCILRKCDTGCESWSVLR